MEKELNILTIGYAKRTLQKGSREQKRMHTYASVLSQYTMIVFTRKSDNLPVVYQKDNLTIYGTNTHTKIGMLYAAYKIGKKVLKEAKDAQWIVSSQDPFETSVIGRALSRTSKAVHHIQIHGDPFTGSIWRKESFLNRLRYAYGLFVLKRARGVRVVSKRVKKSIVEKGISKDIIKVLPIVSDMSNFLQVGATRTYEHKETFTFLYTGRLAKEKNIDRILAVFAEAHKRDASIRLRIVGEGPCEQSLKEQVKLLDIVSAVSFVPWTDSVAEEMSQADVFILASSHEGYGMVLQEAMATGLPVITTDVGCVGDMFVHSKDGIVVTQENNTEFVDAIRSLSKDDSRRECFGRNAHQTVKGSVVTEQEYIQQWKNSLMIR